MEKIIIDLLNIYLNTVNQDKFTSLFVVSFTIISILLFKEYRKNINDSYQNEQSQVKEGIILYNNALLACKRYKNNAISFDDLCIELYKLLPIATKESRKLIYDLDKEDLKIDELENHFKEKYNYIRFLLKDDITKNMSNSISDNYSYAINRIKISFILLPILYTLLSLIALIIFITMIFNFEKYTPLQIIGIFIFISIFYLYVVTYVSILDIMFEKRFKLKPLPIVLFIIFALSFLLLCIKIYNIGIYVFCIYVLFYLFISFKISLTDLPHPIKYTKIKATHNINYK